MIEDCEKLFSKLDAPQAPPELRQHILFQIRNEKRSRNPRLMTIFLAGVFAASIFFFVMAAVNFASEINSTGFIGFSSLLVSDFSAVWTNFADFALSLLEALPLFALALMLAGIFSVLWSWSALVSKIQLARRISFQ